MSSIMLNHAWIIHWINSLTLTTLTHSQCFLKRAVWGRTGGRFSVSLDMGLRFSSTSSDLILLSHICVTHHKTQISQSENTYAWVHGIIKNHNYECNVPSLKDVMMAQNFPPKKVWIIVLDFPFKINVLL